MLNTNGQGPTETWLELRDRMGRLWAKYDPCRDVLEFRRGDVRVLFELRVVRQSIQENTGQQPINVLE